MLASSRELFKGTEAQLSTPRDSDLIGLRWSRDIDLAFGFGFGLDGLVIFSSWFGFRFLSLGLVLDHKMVCFSVSLNL